MRCCINAFFAYLRVIFSGYLAFNFVPLKYCDEWRGGVSFCVVWRWFRPSEPFRSMCLLMIDLTWTGGHLREQRGSSEGRDWLLALGGKRGRFVLLETIRVCPATKIAS